MYLKTHLSFLLGKRHAVKSYAKNPPSLWLGFAFTVIAGICREYDKEALWENPALLLLPTVASFLIAVFCFVILYPSLKNPNFNEPAYSTIFKPLLAMIWMTAPLGWLYGVPYERFLNSEAAIIANLITLGVVSVWRVYLLTRIHNVLSHVNGFASVVRSLFAVNLIALPASLFAFANTIQVMGGIEEEGFTERQGIETVSGAVLVISLAALPILLVAIVKTMSKKDTQEKHSSPER